jgi:hypothetical protein
MFLEGEEMTEFWRRTAGFGGQESRNRRRRELGEEEREKGDRERKEG